MPTHHFLPSPPFVFHKWTRAISSSVESEGFDKTLRVNGEQEEEELDHITLLDVMFQFLRSKGFPASEALRTATSFKLERFHRSQTFRKSTIPGLHRNASFFRGIAGGNIETQAVVRDVEKSNLKAVDFCPEVQVLACGSIFCANCSRM